MKKLVTIALLGFAGFSISACECDTKNYACEEGW